MNAMEETHLTIETLLDGKRIRSQAIHDPFLHNKTTVEMSLWDRIKFLFHGSIMFEIKIRGDDDAHRQWFRTDKLPRNKDEASQDAACRIQSSTVDGPPS